MPTYKLIYFDLAGRAEPIRYLFAYANQDYEDYRLARDQWLSFKTSTPFGKLPVLEIDGKAYSQSKAIARYLAKQFNLTGRNELEALECDALIDSLDDLTQGERKLMFERDHEKKEALKKKLEEEEFPQYLDKFENIVSKNGGFTVGSQITWSDLLFANEFESFGKKHPGVLAPYPALNALVAKVNNIPSIKAWREKRPKDQPMPSRRN